MTTTPSLPSANIRCLIVSVPEQKMQLRQAHQILSTYTISTSKFGLGFCKDSFKTPLGRFYIHSKIGNGAAPGEIFRGRQPSGIIAPQGGEEDLITTRILWLGGLDAENANTKDRYIYIHGTNQEHLLGQPASHGCIRMYNSEICELFDRVENNDPVIILNTQFPSR
ncbi:MAG: murein L,D-transpeptidase [Verrucomicrobia bacterium]|nr:MAG: murein L,D-transpeptidase [Verrucomicrobiota bacterium]